MWIREIEIRSNTPYMRVHCHRRREQLNKVRNESWNALLEVVCTETKCRWWKWNILLRNLSTSHVSLEPMTEDEKDGNEREKYKQSVEFNILDNFSVLYVLTSTPLEIHQEPWFLCGLLITRMPKPKSRWFRGFIPSLWPNVLTHNWA